MEKNVRWRRGNGERHWSCTLGDSLLVADDRDDVWTGDGGASESDGWTRPTGGRRQSLTRPEKVATRRAADQEYRRHRRSDSAARSSENASTKRRRQESRSTSSSCWILRSGVDMSACVRADSWLRAGRHRTCRRDMQYASGGDIWLKHLPILSQMTGTRVYGTSATWQTN